MTVKTITLDVTEFNRIYQSELPVNVERVNRTMTASLATIGAKPAALLPVGGVTGTVCTAWPNIRKLINTVLKFSWLLSFLGKDIQELLTHIPEVKAFLAAFDKSVIPSLCGKQPE